jgi:hypothetical protein
VHEKVSKRTDVREFSGFPRVITVIRKDRRSLDDDH